MEEAYLADVDVPQPVAPQSVTKAHLICIEPLDFGYTVSIGCQKFAVESVDCLIQKLGAYLKNPEVVEKDWLGNKKLP